MIADSLAGHFQASPPAGYKPQRVPLQHPDFQAVLYHSGTAVTTKFRDIIYYQIFSGDLRAHHPRSGRVFTTGCVGGCWRGPIGHGKVSAPEVWATNAYVEQSSIGWGQMLRGRLSSLWGEAYVKEMKCGKPKESHEQWTKRVIGYMWKLAFKVWAFRNGVLHGHTLEQT